MEERVDAMLVVLLAMANETLRMTRNPGRNDLCPCGSGLKYKKCHMAKDEAGEPCEPGWWDSETSDADKKEEL